MEAQQGQKLFNPLLLMTLNVFATWQWWVSEYMCLLIYQIYIPVAAHLTKQVTWAVFGSKAQKELPIFIS